MNINLSQSRFTGFMKKYCFHLFAVLALLIPDIQLRFLVTPKVYGSNRDIALFAGIVPTLFNLAWIGLFLWFALAFLPKRWGRIFYILIGCVYIFYSFAQYIYFRIFGQFLRLNSLSVAGEGADYLSYAFSKADGWLICFTLLSILFLVLAAMLWHRPKKHGKIAKVCTVIPVLVLVGLHIYMQPALFNETDVAWDSWSKPRLIYDKFNDPNKAMDVSGLYHFMARDIYEICFADSSYSAEDYEKVDRYFAEKAEADNGNEYTGMLEGKNVIAVMLEGIDDWQISEKYTPVMKYMMDNGINLSNHYAPAFGTGYTLASEFCFNTGYYTPTMAASSVNYVENRYPDSLPQLFRDKGYSANSFHYNNPEFYNRQIFHNSLGYEKYHSFQDYGLKAYEAQSDSLAISTDGIYQDIVKGKPFYSFIVTYSGHLPYNDEKDAKLVLAKKNHPELIDPEIDAEKNNCLILARDTDDFFRTILENLHRDGLLNDTVIVVYTDHYTYTFSDQQKLLEYNQAVGDNIMWRVPAFIYNPELTPLKVTKPTGTADLLPTLVNLFNLDDRHSYIGTDVLDPENRGFVYFNDGSWMEGPAEDGGEIYHYVPSADVDPGLQERIKQGVARVQEIRKINDIVIDGKYFEQSK